MMWTHYLHCAECGVDAGKACRDEDDREALVVCDGRRLHIGDSADRCRADRGRSRRDATPDTRPQAVSRRARGILGTPSTTPCVYCGTPARLWGAAHVTGRTWCSAAECQRDRSRERDAKSNDRRRIREAATPKAPPKTRPCVICGKAVSAHGVNAANEASCPGACRTERWRRRVDAQNARDRLERASDPPLACAWCSSSVPRAGRDPRERACCGAVECVEARRVGYRPRRPEAPCAHCGTLCPLDKPHRRHGLPACSAACSQEITRARERSRPPRLPKATDPQPHMDA